MRIVRYPKKEIQSREQKFFSVVVQPPTHKHFHFLPNVISGNPTVWSKMDSTSMGLGVWMLMAGCLLTLFVVQVKQYNTYRMIDGNSILLPQFHIQCPLGFATLGKAAPLALATSRALTDLRQYINSDLGFSDLKI